MALRGKVWGGLSLGRRDSSAAPGMTCHIFENDKGSGRFPNLFTGSKGRFETCLYESGTYRIAKRAVIEPCLRGARAGFKPAST